MALFRGMRVSEDGFPPMTPGSNEGLGIRAGIDIPVEDGQVRPNTGGMSAFSVVGDLPSHILPVARGGVDDSFQVYSLDNATLGADLAARPKGRKSHNVIEPTQHCTLENYEQSIYATRLNWNIYV